MPRSASNPLAHDTTPERRKLLRGRSSSARLSSERLTDRGLARLLLTPATVVMVFFLFLPLAYGVALSFRHVNLQAVHRTGWAGLANYRALLSDSIFWSSARITVIFGLIFLTVTASTSLITALAMNKASRTSTMVRIVMLLPWAVAPLVGGLMWRSLFHGTYGVVNAVLLQLGVIDTYVQWFGNANYALIIAALGTAWMWMPFFSLVLLAAIQAIPPVLYRAARMDGANPWKQFTNITFPAIRNVFIVTLMFMIVIGLETFDLLYSMTRGGPGFATSVLNYLTYVEGFERLNLGKAAALGLIISVMVMLVGGASILALNWHGRMQMRSGLQPVGHTE